MPTLDSRSLTESKDGGPAYRVSRHPCHPRAAVRGDVRTGRKFTIVNYRTKEVAHTGVFLENSYHSRRDENSINVRLENGETGLLDLAEIGIVQKFNGQWSNYYTLMPYDQ